MPSEAEATGKQPDSWRLHAGGHDGCDPAGVQEGSGMATDQEAAVYSGMVN